MNTFPVFSKEYLSESSEQDTCNFGNYIHYCNNLVNSIQLSEDRSHKEIALTFYPIAKNIRMTASQMAVHCSNGSPSFISNKARNGEADFWRNFKNMGDWYPWLWARGRINNNDNYTNNQGWEYYFDSFSKNDKVLSVKQELCIKPPEHLFLFFLYLSCVKFVFQLNSSYSELMKSYKAAMHWPSESSVLAVQIRRGETCTKDGSITDRPFYHLHTYIENIDRMLEQNNFEYIYISTDSNEEINEIKRIRPEWKLLYLPIDRSQFFRMNENPVDLEVFCSLEPERIPFIVDSGLADLFFISKCQGYISTITVSEFSKIGWYLQMAEQERLTPYINMNDDLLDMSKRDVLLLL
jgi:hypothetical protein